MRRIEIHCSNNHRGDVNYISTESCFGNGTTTTLETGETREKRVRVLEEDEFEQRSRALGNAFAAARFQSYTARRTKAIVSDPPPVDQPPQVSAECPTTQDEQTIINAIR